MLMLLHRQIPDKPGVPAMLGQRRLLSGRGLQPVTGHDQQITDRHRQIRETQVVHRSAFPEGRRIHTGGDQ
jgi:hypothetical protein